MIFADVWPHRQQGKVNPLEVCIGWPQMHLAVEKCGFLKVDCLDLFEIEISLRLVEVVVNGEQ